MDNKLVMQRFDANDKRTWPDSKDATRYSIGCLVLREGLDRLYEANFYIGQQTDVNNIRTGNCGLWDRPCAAGHYRDVLAYFIIPTAENITIVDITERARA